MLIGLQSESQIQLRQQLLARPVPSPTRAQLIQVGRARILGCMLPQPLIAVGLDQAIPPLTAKQRREVAGWAVLDTLPWVLSGVIIQQDTQLLCQVVEGRLIPL